MNEEYTVKEIRRTGKRAFAVEHKGEYTHFTASKAEAENIACKQNMLRGRGGNVRE